MMQAGGVQGMKKTRKRKGKLKQNGMIDFQFDSVSYQIDPGRRKVYHRWVEVETSKTFLIMGAYNQTQVQSGGV